MKKLHHHLQSTEGKFVLGVAIVVLSLFAYYFFTTSSTVSNKVENITITKTDHVKGAQSGTLTLVAFEDFQCPACGVYDPLVRQVLEDNKNILKFVFKHFPLTQIHQNALLAAKASEAAGLQGKFWEMHDMLYDKQADWSKGMNARDVIMSYASILKLNTVKFSEDLNSKALEDKVLADFKEGVALGVQGTPTFFLNGKQIENPASLEAFNTLILEVAAK